ncbi:hypothetical protein OROMI_005098 [Orobanche minor]
MNKAARAALEDKLSSMDRSCSIPWTIKETHFSTALEKISPSVSDKQKIILQTFVEKCCRCQEKMVKN